MIGKMKARCGWVLIVLCTMMLTSCAACVQETSNSNLENEQVLAEQQRLEEENAAAAMALQAEEALAEETRLETERLVVEKIAVEQEALATFLSIFVYFGFDSATLNSESMNVLDAKTDWMRNNPEAKITLEGYCDDRGNPEYNLALGTRRSEAVKNYLVDNGIAEDRIAITSFGKTHPLDINNNTAGWSKNRRVQVIMQ